MKPPPFHYEAPSSVADAVDLLARAGDDAKILAGGQSLIPMLNMRLARPTVLVDINRVTELDYLRRDEEGLHIGALTRHVTVERSEIVRRHWTALHEAVGWIAHPQIRTRGTIGGSVCHADSHAELPSVFAVLDAEFQVQSATGTRVVPCSEFFLGPFETVLGADEVLTEITVPGLPPHTGSAFREYAHRRGDFALAGAAAVLATDGSGRCTSARLSLLGASATPHRAHQAENFLAGRDLHSEAIGHAADLAVADIEPHGGIHGDVRFVTELLRTQTKDTLNAATTNLERRM
jgi:CO/xanthine dehydrogenase FAD-binding subunit